MKITTATTTTTTPPTTTMIRTTTTPPTTMITTRAPTTITTKITSMTATMTTMTTSFFHCKKLRTELWQTLQVMNTVLERPQCIFLQCWLAFEKMLVVFVIGVFCLFGMFLFPLVCFFLSGGINEQNWSSETRDLLCFSTMNDAETKTM